jgi:hypothetical protein
MFKSIITFAKNAVTKYKAQRVKDVVTQYIGLADAQVVMAVPVALEFYRNSAHVIVDKTFENPEPALKLIEALDAVTKHYGPALSAEFKAFSTKLEERGASPVVTSRIEALMQSVNDLTTDVSEDKAS